MPKLWKDIENQATKPNANTRPDESNHSARNWMFTLNNWTEMELMKLKVFAGEKCKYMVIGKEVGKTGVPHLQGYMQLEKATRGQTIKNQSKVLRLWMGIANAPEKADKYCKKDGDFETIGEIDLNSSVKAGSKKGGASTKATWQQLYVDIKNGMSFDDCMEKYPAMVMQTRNAVLAECIRFAPKRDFKTCVHVYIGESGAGKTTRARIDAPDAFMVTPGMQHWFDGYNGRSDVIIDEMRKGQYSVGTLLSMMDQHPCSVQVKGGMVNFAPKTLVITSNIAPNQWYKEDTMDHATRTALWRRINVCKYFKKGDPIGEIEDYDEGWDMYHNGCVCGHSPKLTRTGTLIVEESPPPSPRPVLDLADSEFVTPVEPAKLTLNSMKRPVTETSTSLPKPKKQKGLPNLPGKKVGDLTKKMDELYGPPDPILIDSESDQSDEDSYPGDYGDLSDDDVETFSSSFDENINSMDEDISESLD